MPLSQRPTADLVSGLLWCAVVAGVAVVWLGGWLIDAGFSLAGILLLAALLLTAGLPLTGVVKITLELRRRHAR